MGSGGGGSETTETEPWKGQQPYLRDLFGAAQDIYRQGYGQEYYPGQLVSPFAPQQMQAMDMLQQSAYGSPTQDAMGNYLMGSMMNPYGQAGVGMEFGGGMPMGGGYGESTPPGGMPSAAPQMFSGNPYLDAMYGTAAQRAGEQFQAQTMPGIAAQFGGAGRTGSGIHQQVAQGAASDFGRDLQGMAANIYGPAYEAAMDRDIQRRQLGADIGKTGAMLAPTMQTMQQQNIANMMQAGDMTQQQAQALIDAEVGRHQFYQQAPWQALGGYANALYGLPSGYGTTTAPGPESNRLAGAAGGAMTGYQVSGGNPWGAAIGGGLGLLMS